MVGIDRGHARMRVHGNDDRSNARQRIERLKIGRHATHADDDTVHGQRGHTTRGLGKRKLLGLGHLDQRDGAAALAGRAGNAVDHRKVAKLGDIVDAQADRMVTAVAQRATGITRTKAKLLHSGLHALARLFVNVGQAVGDARNRLLRNASSAGDVGHGDPTRTGIVGRAPCHRITFTLERSE